MSIPNARTPHDPGLPAAPVASCVNCARPVVRPLAGPRSGTWLHTDGEENCRDRWGHPWPNLVATPGGRRDDRPARFRRPPQPRGGAR